jgi:hypothetical protein
MKKPMKELTWVCNSVTLVVCALVLGVLGSAGTTWAAPPLVTNLNDSGAGSLRQAIADAAAGDTITLQVHGTIALTRCALTIGKSLNIEGSGAKKLAINGNDANRVFIVLSGNVTLAGITISNGMAYANSPVMPSVGGAVLNLANLNVSEAVVSDSQALGDASQSPSSFPGAGFGGGIANFGTLAVKDSSFIGNLARGGDGSSPHGSDRPLAGFGGGGGIINFVNLTVSGSRFSFNQAVGGNGNVSQFLSGHGYGGAIVSGGPVATPVIDDSEFDHNQAIGGNGNNSPTVPATIGPNKSSGGAIDVIAGTATIDGCTLEHNLSLGGAGGSDGHGGIGSGGAIVSTNFGGYGTNATVINSKIEHNKALGGPGGQGGDGGEGEGGGLTSTAGGILTVINTTVAHNHAQGGKGVAGGNGGNGLGGGLYNFDLSPLDLQGAIVSYNLALGGEAEDGGSASQGIGGGIYHLGPFSFDSATVIEKNQATTSNDNLTP